MNEEYFYADVNLPFHVWVRETSGGKTRWVLREAASIQDDGERAAPGAQSTTAAERPNPLV